MISPTPAICAARVPESTTIRRTRAVRAAARRSPRLRELASRAARDRSRRSRSTSIAMRGRSTRISSAPSWPASSDSSATEASIASARHELAERDVGEPHRAGEIGIDVADRARARRRRSPRCVGERVACVRDTTRPHAERRADRERRGDREDDASRVGVHQCVFERELVAAVIADERALERRGARRGRAATRATRPRASSRTARRTRCRRRRRSSAAGSSASGPGPC